MTQSDDSWDRLSDHRHCKTSESHEDLSTSWQWPSRPASPPLDVPETSTSPWQHVSLLPPSSAPPSEQEDDHEVALRLYRELEGRSYRAEPSEAGSGSTVQGFKVKEIVRYAVTPPPDPDPMLVDDLKAFQWSEGTRLAGYIQCNQEARTSLVAFLASEGYDPEIIEIIADEVDGEEGANGLARNQYGAWYFLHEGEKGREKRPPPVNPQRDVGHLEDDTMYPMRRAAELPHVTLYGGPLPTPTSNGPLPSTSLVSIPAAPLAHMTTANETMKDDDETLLTVEVVKAEAKAAEIEAKAARKVEVKEKLAPWVAQLLEDADEKPIIKPMIRKRKNATGRAKIMTPGDRTQQSSTSTEVSLEIFNGDGEDPFDIAC